MRVLNGVRGLLLIDQVLDFRGLGGGPEVTRPRGSFSLARHSFPGEVATKRVVKPCQACEFHSRGWKEKLDSGNGVGSLE